MRSAHWLGLSPRVRGDRAAARTRRRPQGSIPACAGGPIAWVALGILVLVYPRVCGGTGGEPGCRRGCGGLSPRVRGDPRPPRQAGACHRSIPACAGGPQIQPTIQPLLEVYPRVCGGTIPPVRRMGPGAGLSPRVRGDHLTPLTTLHRSRSIPACAGGPCLLVEVGSLGWVYPRVCGGTAE